MEKKKKKKTVRKKQILLQKKFPLIWGLALALIGLLFVLVIIPAQLHSRVLGVSTTTTCSNPFTCFFQTATKVFSTTTKVTTTITDTEGMVDTFGQYTGATWTGKITSAKDIINSRNQETYLGIASDRDEYGGFKDVSVTNTTGSFTTAKVGNRWFLIDPAGHPFYSIGMDVVTDTNATVVGGKESLFSNAHLPGYNSTDPLATYYGKYDGRLTYDFYKANLYRANNNNPHFQSDWKSRMYNRLTSWGFNTLANWSDSNLYTEKKMPYMVAIDSYLYAGHIPKMIHINSSTDMPDVFDTSFAETTAYGMKIRGVLCAGNPWCIGVFVDNEVPFNGRVASSKDALVRAVLLLSQANSQAKYYFTNRLRIKYSTIGNLNKAWNSSFTSWDDFAQKSVTLPTTLNTNQAADVKKMVADYAYKYFAVVSSAVHTYIPHKLYLGPRFLTFDEPIEAIYGCGYYCDVVSFNEYRTTLTSPDLAVFSRLNKPILTGEFHFTASDRGLSQDYLMGVGTQEARAKGYTTYVNSALSLPSVVGFGWFQYLDEPLTDRILDKEDYNTGFVTITDTIYPELVSAATEINRGVYKKLFPSVTPVVTPTPTLAPGCYYTYRCMGIANKPCEKIVVCPTNVPQVMGQSAPLSPSTSGSTAGSSAVTQTPTTISSPSFLLQGGVAK